MKTKRQILGGMMAAVLFAAAGCFIAPGNAMAQDADNEDTEVLTRGPVHEAFAETVVFDPEPGITVPKQPPELIEEVQPDQRPVGTNVTWIPGYWAWDDDDSDFFWISGVWRNLPPDREWVPGYWSPVENSQYQWTSGYWEDSNTEEVSYLPQPPRSLEKGPNVAASSDNQVWIPGTWQYRNDNYAWRAGYWVDARPNYAWTPSYYRWTPRGYIYVDGYWDYPVVNRGVVFAPVRFRRPVYYERPNYYYTPATVISLAVFTNHLFVRPRYGHYYFGDYYDPGYRERYYASYDYGHRYRGYDPIFVHSRWEHRHDRNWERQRREFFEYRRDNAGSRPPRTWAAYNRMPERERERGEYRMADRLDRMVGDRDGRVRFQKVDDDERQRINTQRKAVREFGRERAQSERTGQKAKSEGEGRGQATRDKVKRSPVAAKRDNRDEKAGGPPPRLQRRDADDNDGGKDKGKGNGNGNGNDKNAAKDTEERTKPGQRREEAGGKKGDGGNNGNAKKGEGNREGMNDGNAKKGEGNRGEGNGGNAKKGEGNNGGNRGDANKSDGNREGTRGEANKEAGGSGGNRGDANKSDGNREGTRGEANKEAGGNRGNNANKGEGSGSGGNRGNANQGDGGKKATPTQGGGEKKAAPTQGGGGGEKKAAPTQGGGGGQKKASSNQGGGQKKASSNDGGGQKKASQGQGGGEKKSESAQPKKRESAQAQPRKAERQPQQVQQVKKQPQQQSQQKASSQGGQQRKAQNTPQASGGGQKKSAREGGGGGKKDGGGKEKDKE